jgi:uncharacterized RDD family membrane protein YckC
MTTGLTNCPIDGDSAVQNPLRPGAIEATGIEATGVSGSENSVPEAKVFSDADSWRKEVAARLERYRTRRKPRTPRYPSLLLPFDAPESWSRPSSPNNSAAVFASAPPRNQDSPVPTSAEIWEAGPPHPLEPGQTSAQTSERHTEQAAEQSAKVIEFPRSAAIPVFHSSELADPIFDRPRIVEAPEILPPPPALGGMLIEPAQPASPDSQTSTDFPSGSASIGQRALSALVDGAIVAAAVASCAAIFLRLNPVRAPLLLFAGALAVGILLFWAVYEFLFVVYTGSTPGLRAVRLRLATFDGSPVSRRLRRWRVLASFLSAFSAGLGYLWCVLDQEALCWHDRITRTHIKPAPPTK